jgi:hypothetical protein
LGRRKPHEENRDGGRAKGGSDLKLQHSLLCVETIRFAQAEKLVTKLGR